MLQPLMGKDNFDAVLRSYGELNKGSKPSLPE